MNVPKVQYKSSGSHQGSAAQGSLVLCHAEVLSSLQHPKVRRATQNRGSCSTPLLWWLFQNAIAHTSVRKLAGRKARHAQRIRAIVNM